MPRACALVLLLALATVAACRASVAPAPVATLRPTPGAPLDTAEPLGEATLDSGTLELDMGVW